MYRIRLASGEQAVYKTVEELAAAVSSGVVSPTAEVFHKAANRWLPINTHPDYRAVVTDKRPALPETTPEAELPQRHTPATRKSDAAVELEKLELLAPQPAEAAAPPEPEAPRPEAHPTPVQPQPAIEEAPDLVAQSEQESQAVLAPIDRPRRPLLLITLTAGSLVALAAVVAILLGRRTASREVPATRDVAGRLPAAQPLTPDSTPARPTADRSAVAPSPSKRAATTLPAAASPGPVRSRPDTVTVDFSAPSKPLAPARPADRLAPPTVGQPGKVTSRLGSSVNRMPSYYEAYADARAEMDEGLGYVDFRRVFAPTRFSSADSIRAARRMVAAAGNILRVYRGREVMLEQTYRPGESDGKGSLRETFEVAEASRGLLADVDSLFAILVAQEGEVRLRDNALQFQNPGAAHAYNQVRREILQTLSYLGDPAEAADRVTMPRLLRGFGTERPPPAR
jgi:hypothetical protein